MSDKNEERRQPAEAYPPGVFIREEMKERGWSENDLVEKAQLGARHANQILSGSCVVDSFVAERLAKAFDVSAEFFINLQSSYDQYAQFKNDLGDVMIKELYEQLASAEKENEKLQARIKAATEIYDSLTIAVWGKLPLIRKALNPTTEKDGEANNAKPKDMQTPKRSQQGPR